MSRHAHEGPPVAVRAAVLTVSTTRTEATDSSGRLLAEGLAAAGHVVVDRRIVPDDPAAIGAALDGWLGGGEVRLVLTTGGTGVSTRDCTARVVRARLTRELPGFGELFRMLSWGEIGAAAMLSDAVGGLAGQVLVFALPGSSAACRLGLEKLVLPELGHLVRELEKEPSLPPSTRAPEQRPVAAVARAPEPAAGLAVAVVPHEPAPVAAPPGAAPAPPPPGWSSAVAALGLTLGPVRAVVVPEELPPAVRDVLAAAGESREADDGSRLYGYPDAHRPGSRMLQLLPDLTLRALHRWPRRVGTAPDEPLAAAATARGLPAPPRGTLYATDSGVLYLLDGVTVSRWDGTSKALGRPAQVLASLVLEWSQR